MSAKEIISVIVAGLVGVVWAVLEIKRWRSSRKVRQVEEENNLQPNPTRCKDHEDRLRGVEAICHTIGPKLEGIDKNISDVKGSVQRLVDLHLKE